MKFDLISDVHLEKLILERNNEITVPEFVQSILPEYPSTIIVVAGDFGYYNLQNLEFLKELRKTYQKVLYVYGNNDIKVNIHHNIEGYKNAKIRVDEFEKEVKKIDGVYHLDGVTLEVEGVTFGGSNIFYDFLDLEKQFSMSEEEIYDAWEELDLNRKHRGYIEDIKGFAEREKEKLRSVIKKSDVIITHGAPNYFVPEEDAKLGFYRFSGDEFIPYIQGKVWCMGHKHERMMNVEYAGCRFYNATYVGAETEKIITITI